MSPSADPLHDPALGLVRVLDDEGGASAHRLSDEELLKIFGHMLRIRLIDERMLMRQRQGKVGFYGASTGQEATPIAAAFCLRPGDWVFPALREALIMLVRGYPLSTWLAQIYGNAGDVMKGRQQPMHMAGRGVNQVSWSSCLGPQLPQAVGCAFAMKKRKEPHVALAFTGDGATSEPDFHAAMNFAAVWRVPVVFVCQNNHWAISVPSSKQSASATFAIKARAYGMPGVRVDGNDVLALHQVIGDAIARARAGEGPTLIEALTYRIGSHSSSDDPRLYRSDEEVEIWRKRDPIDRMNAYLRGRGLVDDGYHAKLSAELTEEILAAIRETESHGAIARETLFDDVYAQLPWHLQEQRETLLQHPPAPAH